MAKEHLLAWLKEGNLTIPATLLTNYKKLNLSEIEVVLLLHLLNFQQQGNQFPTPQQLATLMTLTESECSHSLNQLINKGFITIIEGKSADGILYERYCLESLKDNLIHQFINNIAKDKSIRQHEQQASLYSIFEQEFGRPLSPFEGETISIWLDEEQYSEEIILAALRESVISGKVNFRYIDRILFNWKRNGIKTVEQAREHSKKFRAHQQQSEHKSSEQSSQSVLFYNWLEK